MLYSDILDLWIEEKHLEIRNSSYNNYLYTIKNRVKPELGSLSVDGISRKMLQDYIIRQSEKLKQETVINITSVKRFSEQKKNIVNIAYRTGMRIGEILVLKWEDINFDQNLLTVKRTLSSYNNGQAEICEPKTKGSRRRIDLDNNSMEILKNIDKNGEYVFVKKDGSILSRQCIYQSFKRMCKTANVPYHSFHSLRHTHAT